MLALRFELPVPQGLHGALRAEAERAINELARVEQARDEAIHEARRAIRRVRAMLALARPTVGAETVRAWAGPWRAAGRALSALRDADSLRKAIEALAQDDEAVLDRVALAALAASARRRLAGAARAQAGVIADVHAALRAALADLPDCAVIDLRALNAGLSRGYRVGRRRMRAVAAVGAEDILGDDLAWHALRRAARTHWLQLELVVRAWPAVLKAQARQARRLSQLLGAERDLAMIESLILERRRAGPVADRVRALLPWLRARRVAMRTEAVRRARRQFDERTRDFARRIGGLMRLAAAPRAVPVAPQSTTENA